jgi:hypothetical protein
MFFSFVTALATAIPIIYFTSSFLSIYNLYGAYDFIGVNFEFGIGYLYLGSAVGQMSFN